MGDFNGLFSGNVARSCTVSERRGPYGRLCGCAMPAHARWEASCTRHAGPPTIVRINELATGEDIAWWMRCWAGSVLIGDGEGGMAVAGASRGILSSVSHHDCIVVSHSNAGPLPR